MSKSENGQAVTEIVIFKIKEGKAAEGAAAAKRLIEDAKKIAKINRAETYCCNEDESMLAQVIEWESQEECDKVFKSFHSLPSANDMDDLREELVFMRNFRLVK